MGESSCPHVLLGTHLSPARYYNMFAHFVDKSIVLDFGGPNRENRQGKDLRGVEGYLEGIFGNPSLVKIQGKTIKKHRKDNKKQRKAKKRKSFEIQHGGRHREKYGKTSKIRFN